MNPPPVPRLFGVRRLVAAFSLMRSGRLHGAALPFVLIILALNVVVIVAMLAYATTEYQASRNSVQAESARVLAQSGIDLAAGIISANSTNNAFVTYQRVPQDADNNHRLETKIGNVVAPDSAQPWKTAVNNPVVLHSGFTTSTNGFDLNYAADTNGQAGYIAPRMNVAGWQNLSPNMFLMDWIYVFKTNANGSSNVVGRIAYWVDDESTKLNVNYSGTTSAYNAASYSQNNYLINLKLNTNLPIRTSADLGGLALPTDDRMGRVYPLDMELGGIAGLSTTNAYVIISNRGSSISNNPAASPNPFKPYPSVLGVRLATISNAPGGLAITDLNQQAQLGFTATIYSKEDERTYARGAKRYDLLRFPREQNIATRDASDGLPAFTNAILQNYPDFRSKYDIPAFGRAAYAVTTRPSFGGTTAYNHAAASFDTNVTSLYARGMPLLNEVSFTATCTAKTNIIGGITLTSAETTVNVGIELILMQRTEYGSYWGLALATNTNTLTATVEFPGATTPLIYAITNNTWTLAPSNSIGAYSWFSTNANTNIGWKNGANNYFYCGPNPTASDANSAFSNALGVLSFSNTYTNTNTSPFGVTNFPTSVKIQLKCDGVAYQTVLLPGFTATNFAAPAVGATNVYQFVAQPSGGVVYRGDPRFINDPNLFTSYVDAALGTTNSGLTNSLGHLNTNPVNAVSSANWQLDSYATDSTWRPDSLPTYECARDTGFSFFSTAFNQGGLGLTGLNGTGPIGDIPVTTPPGVNRLAFSTPRLWGDGRGRMNGTNYPPDWLLLDCFHLSIYGTNSTGAFLSYGRLNVNGAKPFFQVMTNSTNRSCTVIDSPVVGTLIKDWVNGGGNNLHTNAWTDGFTIISASDSSRTNLLTRINDMIQTSNSANTPYVTHFAFLADLAATNIAGNPGWWFAPDPATGGGSIYSAANTTDRRIEGVVRSLNQKFTTHGNQFTIFSVGQALQPSPNGTVDVPGGGKANVVGEAYLQAVYERAPLYDEATGAITNSPTGAPAMRQLFLRELR